MESNAYSAYRQDIRQQQTSASLQYMAAPALTAHIVTQTATTTHIFNSQLDSYLQACRSQQDILLQRTQQYMNKVYADVPTPSASLLRDKGTWTSVKRLVVREELMKAQITGKLDVSFPNIDEKEILAAIKDLDLSKMNDAEINAIIDKFIEVDARSYLDALIQFKNTGEVSGLLQTSKLPELSKELQNIDLNHITDKQYKYLRENYCERPEYHHRESISSDPQKQSMADNIDVLDTTAHDQKHVDSETGKINYKKPVNEEPLNRTGDMIEGNKARVLRNELTGLGMAAAIGLGMGVTMSLVSGLARAGLDSDRIGDVVFDSLVSGTESGTIAAVTYAAGRGATHLIETVGVDLLSASGYVANFAAIGVLSTSIVCAYQFTKSRLKGASTGEALELMGRTAMSSMTMLAVSLAAQGIWGGPAGIIVSTGAGLAILIVDTGKTVHARRLEARIREYSIEEYRNAVDSREPIYIIN